jgi:basic membrane protein A and related proteins
MRGKLLSVGLGILACGGLLAACDDGGGETTKTKAAWVYISQPGDLGWTYAHDQGRLQVELQVDDVETTYVDSVAETPEALGPVLDDLVADGNQIIFTTSFGYMQPTFDAAGRHPDVKFEHCSGYLTDDNMAAYFGRMYQARYLTGIVAGRMTTNGHIGYVAAFPIPEVVRMLNAFTLGVRSVNPTATVEVRWTCTWFDPVVEAAAADELLAAGCDLLAQHQDSTATAERAAAAGKWAIGYDSDILSFVPDAVLTSAVWHWGPYYSGRVQAVKDGTWVSQNYWGSIADSIVGVGAYNDAVTQAVRDEVAAKQAELVAGTWDVFYGPVYKQDGSVWVAQGVDIPDAEKLSMAEFVQGVVGLPTGCN